MRKILTLGLLLLAWGAAADELPAGSPLISDLEIEVTVADVESALWGMTREQRRQVERNPGNLERVLDSLYLNRVLAAEAREQGLDRDEIMQLRLQQRREAELTRLWLRGQDDPPDWEAVEEARRPQLDEAALQDWAEGLN